MIVCSFQIKNLLINPIASIMLKINYPSATHYKIKLLYFTN